MMLRDIAGHSDGMLFRQSIVPSFKVAQLWMLCHTSKDFYGMFRPCVLSCLDLKDDQLQKAFVARLRKAIFSKSWPLEMRSATMCSATMAQLKSKGHDLEERDDSGMTALMWASYNGEANTARVLVEYGASLETVDREDGMTALLWASYEGHADTVGVLVEHCASLEAVDEEGNTALQLASDNYKRKVAKVLCKHGARGALCYAAKNNLLRDMVAELISKGHDLKECDKDGTTALELAAEANDGEGHSEVVGLLIKAGIEAGQWQDVNACLGSAGKTLLMYASQCGQEESMQTLIEKGASLDEVDKDGATALMWASYNGQADTVSGLLEHRASLEAADREGMTALMWASREGHADTARVLVKHGASLEAVDREHGMTALLWASYEGHADTVGVLVEHCASLEAVDEEGNTALQLASDNYKRKVAKVLCKHGARGALCYAAKNDLRDMVEELISKGHDLKECDKRGNTALQLASDYGKGEVVKVLCKHGARGALCYAAKNDLL